jgi:hypothetical protein
MSKIREEAKHIVNGDHEYFGGEDAQHQAKRVLLLEKIVRYLRVVDCLMSWIVWDIGQTGRIMGDRQKACEQKAKQYRAKAAELYRRAEKL